MTTRTPWTQMYPADLALARRTGVPEEAISEDGSLDVDLLRRLGWTVTDSELRPPVVVP